MINDSFIGVAPDAAGKAVDNTAVTQDGGLVVQRQRVNLSDPTFPNNHMAVGGDAAARVAEPSMQWLLTQILLELRVMNVVLHDTLNSTDDLDRMRADPSMMP